MNRRRVLNGVHRTIARQAAEAVTEAVPPTTTGEIPFERLLIRDLDRVGEKLITARRDDDAKAR